MICLSGKIRLTSKRIGPPFVWSLTQAMISLSFVLFSFSPATSATFHIEPTSLDLGSDVRSGAFSVTNGGAEKLNVQMSVQEWTQDAEGKDIYSETGDIVFFPKIMTIEPNEQRAIRIGVKGPPSLQERTFRLFVEEIPSQAKSSDAKASEKISAGLTIAFRYAVPIFLKPVRVQESGLIEKIGMSGGVAKAVIRNNGNIHLKLLIVTFRGKAADGKELFSKDVGGWYVLHGMSRPYEVTVPRGLCGDLASIEINAQAENLAIRGTLDVTRDMCAP